MESLRRPFAALMSATVLVLGVPAVATALDWHGPQPIAPAGATEPDLAVDATGGAVAVWRRGTNVEAAFRPPGGVFSSAQVLGPADSRPSVEMDAGGTAVAVWRSAGNAMAAVRSPGGAFAPPVVLGADSGDGPRVAMSQSGHAVAWWYGGNNGLAASRRQPGGTFEEPKVVAPANTIFSHVRIDGAGDVLAVWERFVTTSGDPGGGTGAFRIEAADLRHDAAAWGPVQTVMEGAGQLPRLALGEDGTAAVTVAGMSPPQTTVRHPGGSWSTPVALGTSSPAVVTGADGRVHAAWHDADANEVRLRVRAPGGDLGVPATLAAADSGLFNAALGLAGDGAQTLVWRFGVMPGQAQPPLRAVTRTPAGALDARALAAPANGTLSDFHTAFSASGNAVVVGHTTDTSRPLVAWVRDVAYPAEPSRLGTPPPTGGPPPAPPGPDVVAPRLRRTASTSVALRTSRIRLRLSCDEACRVGITGSADPRGKARAVKLRAQVATLPSTAAKTVSVALTKTARRALRRARGGVVRLRLVALDAAGNRSKGSTVRVVVRRR